MMIAPVDKDDVGTRTPQMFYNLKPPESGTDNNNSVSREYRRIRGFVNHCTVASSQKMSDLLPCCGGAGLIA